MPHSCILVGELSNCCYHFLRLVEFSGLFGKYFVISSKFSQLDFFPNGFSREQCKQKNLISFVTMQGSYNGRNAILWKLHFFNKNYGKQEKEVDTKFVSFYLSLNITGWFTKTYLHRPIKILQFLIDGRIRMHLA